MTELEAKIIEKLDRITAQLDRIEESKKDYWTHRESYEINPSKTQQETKPEPCVKPHHEVCDDFRENYFNHCNNGGCGPAFVYENGGYVAGFSAPFKFCPACGEGLSKLSCSSHPR